MSKAKASQKMACSQVLYPIPIIRGICCDTIERRYEQNPLTHKASKCKMHIDAKSISEREHIRN